MRKFSLSRPYIGVWLLQYSILWSTLFINYPDSLKMTFGVIFVVSTLMTVPWLLLSLNGIREIVRHEWEFRRSSRKSRRQRLSRFPAATPRRAKASPAAPSPIIPEIRRAKTQLPYSDIDRATWMVVGHGLKAYIMRPHVHTSAIQNVHGSYIKSQEHLLQGKGAQYYQDRALGLLAAYHTEQHRGCIPPDTSRYLLERAQQACRALVIQQATPPEHVSHVAESCYEALSQQAEQLIHLLSPTLHGLAEEIANSTDTSFDEAALLSMYARFDQGMPYRIDAAAA